MIEITNIRIDLALQDDAITVLFGPSGIGKSTLLKQLAGHQPLQGSLTFAGESIENTEKRTKPEHRQFCYLSQRLNLIQTLTVSDNLALAKRFSHADDADQLLQDMIAMVEIDDLLDRQTSQLSGGEYQLVSFCMAMVSGSRWLLFDEPFSAVDKKRLHRILARFRRWQQSHKVPVLYITHDVHEMALIADDVLHMSGRNITELKSYQSLIQDVDSDFIATYANENVLVTEWIRTEDNLQLLQLQSAPEQHIWAQGEQPEETTQWLSVPLVDISLSRYKLADSSILNQLEGIVELVGQDRDGICYVSIRVGEQLISARITTKSRNELKLSEGIMCVVCFKAPKLVG